MITKDSDFIADIYLPQVGEDASTFVNESTELDSYIQKYEPEILVKALGRQLYNEFSTNFDENGTLIENVDLKWTNLLNGVSYEKSGITYYWRGLRDATGCLPAYYVYYHYVIENITQLTTLGTVKAEAKNASSASAIPSVIGAWRTLYNWYMGENTVKPNVYSYKGVYVTDYFSGNNSKEVSLYQFLSDNKVYDNWCFTPMENKNTWGL